MLNALQIALAERTLDDAHQGACRLFNGPIEGCPDLIVDLYGKTLLVHNYAEPAESARERLDQATEFYRGALPWLETIVIKDRHGLSDQARWGRVVFGEKPDTRITEHGVRYAIDMLMNHDASFYLDTRNLRKWALDNLEGKSVLNTFAYTGSLGVAAKAAGASRVVHTDLSKRFLNQAKTSYTLNGFPIAKRDFITGDFFKVVKTLGRAGDLFDCVFLDPPFFSTTRAGSFEMEKDTLRLINKVRPLVAHGGVLVAVNNALFLSGADYMAALESLVGPYLDIEGTIDVPADFTGTANTQQGTFPADPAPFNHPTKIALLRIRRKS